MFENDTQSRRRFLTGALASGVAAGAGMSLALPAVAAVSHSDAFAIARAHLSRLGGRVAHRDTVAVVDFNQASRAPRMHLLDMVGGRATSLLVSHGRGSDPGHSGFVKSFSNKPGSAASSEGAYLTGAYYTGKHGRSMRLAGLDPTNDNAEMRAIVVHGAWYVSPKMVSERGVLGRSEGCFALCESDLPMVLARMGAGRLIVAGKFPA